MRAGWPRQDVKLAVDDLCDFVVGHGHETLVHGRFSGGRDGVLGHGGSAGDGGIMAWGRTLGSSEHSAFGSQVSETVNEGGPLGSGQRSG
jgi:hypothetical protein